ncbi:hypothetical protein JHK82_024531 [Glycine max]|nr:hypothetical protein JHK85_025131 [Glycine max]KAG5012369.1 hypothetical protein JHK86_024630 [Glycine max]KAG5133343.1 hypothetical protein JHK82_024531 [Glycine max]
MEDNRIGIILIAFGKFQKMQVLDVSVNKLSGEIRAFISNLSQLFHLEIGENVLGGNIPPSIGNCLKLQYLNPSQNNLTRTIPLEVFNLFCLTNLLDLSDNSLSSSIPEELGNLKHINLLDVSENHLSGYILGNLRECTMLDSLYLKGNTLQGIIPSSLASLKEYFNVFFNMLNGEVPTEGVFQNASGFVMTGNSNLCGGIFELHLPPYPVKGKKLVKHHKFCLIVMIESAFVSHHVRDGHLPAGQLHGPVGVGSAGEVVVVDE